MSSVEPGPVPAGAGSSAAELAGARPGGGLTGALPNSRDLGGLPFADGGVTRSGVLLRSSSPYALDASGWATYAAEGLTTIVDLRSPGEGESVAGLPEGIDYLARPVEDKEAEFFAERFANRWPFHDYFADAMAEWPELWVAALDAVADAPGGALVHCFAGRDRTGHVVAMVLDAAGVERDAIVEDYVAGWHGYNALVSTDPPGLGWQDDEALSATALRAETSMREFLDAVRDPRIVAAAQRAGARLR